MAHMVETMAYSGDVPWHGLGRKVSNNLTPVEMMKSAGVDWHVHEIPTCALYRGEKFWTGQKALIRGDTGEVLSNVSSGWHTVQNVEAFEFFRKYVLAGDMEMHTAGSLKSGGIVWVLAKVNESFEIFDGDQVDSYLLFSNPHLYGTSINVRFTPIRVVCHNTLTFALETNAKRAVKLNHASEFKAERVQQILGLSSRNLAKCKKIAKLLGSKRYHPDDLDEYYSQVFPIPARKVGDTEAQMNTDVSVSTKAQDNIPNNAMRCREYLEKQDGAKHGQGTWWQVFNSVTYFTDHIQGKNAENRLYSQWFGENQRRKDKAAKLAVQYAKSAKAA